MLSKKRMLEIERIKKKPSKLAQYKQSEQYLELVDAAIEANPLMYPVVREDLKTMELNLKAVKGNGLVLEYINNQTEEICLEAVRSNGLALAFVKKQTNKICFEAISENGKAIHYVKNKTEELYLEAVRTYPEIVSNVNGYSESFFCKAIEKNINSFMYIKDKGEELITKALSLNGMLLEFVEEPTLEYCMIAYKQNNDAIRYFNF